MWLYVWALIIVAVQARPQYQQFDQSRSNVELSKQDILHVTFNSSIRDEATQRRIEENTREILEKIEALNKKQGLTKKKKPSYLHFPFSYSRSQENSENGDYNKSFQSNLRTDQFVEEPNHGKVISSERGSDFMFPTNPFQNPIFQYLQNEQNLPSQLKSTVLRSPAGFMSVMQTNPNAEITEVDKIPGEYIQRKVTHQQTLLIPNMQTDINSQHYEESPPSIHNYQRYNPPILPALVNQFISPAQDQQKIRTPNNKHSLEKQTINNIKNIIRNSQTQNPYLYPYFESSYQPLFAIPQISNYGKVQSGTAEAPALLYGPYVVPNLASALPRQFQSPLQNYFPMVIKDPLVQLYNAITTMVEYGQQASCKTKTTEDSSEASTSVKVADEVSDPSGSDTQNVQQESKESNEHQINEERYIYDTKDRSDDNNPFDLTNLTDKENITLQLESKEFKEDENSSTINTRSPKVKTQEKLHPIITQTDSNLKVLSHPSNTNIKENGLEDSRPFIKINQKPFSNIPTSTVKIGIVDNIMRRGAFSPTRGQITKEENDKRIRLSGTSSGEDTQVSHDGNKKLFSKDNTGSGIFIHKLKVRRGGVAIAGPGGIATAGDGGTAIVGPNGYAYTQPDSLAIAGTGTKVIAVEPSVNLSELVKNNKTRFGGLYPQRLGKVVAVGPVIYYNKGFIAIPHGVIFPSWSASNFEQLTLNPYIYFDDSFLPPETGDGFIPANNKPKTTEFVTPSSAKNREETKLYRVDSENNKNAKLTHLDESNEINNEEIVETENNNNKDNKSSIKVSSNPINSLINTITSSSLRNLQNNEENSLAPYRFHPLLHYLKQKTNLGNSKVIEIRNDKTKPSNGTITLILKPVARSVAGVNGKAISNPVSRAALRRGANVDILFEPDAIAIAGPGGIAHAESDLDIYYEDSDPNEKFKDEEKKV